MAKPERIKVVLKRKGYTISLLDIFRDGNEYHATQSGSSTKHTYHASGRKHTTITKNRKKEYVNVQFLPPSQKMKGWFGLASMTIPVSDDWHKEDGGFKKYSGSKVALLEIIDGDTLEEGNHIHISAGLAENIFHMKKRARRLEKSAGKLIVKKFLKRPDGPMLVLFISISKPIRTPDTWDVTMACVLTGGDIITIVNPNRIFENYKPDESCQHAGELPFKIDKNMPTQYTTVSLDIHNRRNGYAFDFEIRAYSISPCPPPLRLVLAIIPRGATNNVTDFNVYTSFSSNYAIPLFAGIAFTLDLRFSEHTYQRFNLLGNWYQLAVKKSRLERIALLDSSATREDLLNNLRSHFEIEVIKLMPECYDQKITVDIFCNDKFQSLLI